MTTTKNQNRSQANPELTPSKNETTAEQIAQKAREAAFRKPTEHNTK